MTTSPPRPPVYGAHRRSPIRNVGTATLHWAVASLVVGGLCSPSPAAAEEMGRTEVAVSAQEEVATIRGRVVDRRSGRGIAGAQVQWVGTDVGTLTDAAGGYVLPNLPAGVVRLRVRHLGYADGTGEWTLPAGGEAVADFELSESALALDAIVVTGTAGQARQREVGNSIVQVDLSSLDEPIANVDQLLQGRAPSVNVNPGSASFGAGAAIRLRGNVSVTQSNQPLIFVDGVRQSAEAYPLNASQGSFANYGPSAVMSPLNDLNPSDIQRIEIVKGAAAATLYGSEASAGVIQIFTRSGGQGSPVWTLQSDHGVDWVKPFGSESKPYLGMDPWLKRAYGTRNSLSVSGGASGIRYFVSSGFDDERGVLPNDEGTRLSLRANLDLTIRPDLEFQVNNAFTNHRLSITHSGNSGLALPFNVFRAPNNSFGSADPEVLSRILEAEIHQENTRFTSGITGQWSPRSGIRQRLTLGLDRVASRGDQFRPLGFALDPVGMVSDLRWESQTVTLDYSGSVLWNGGDLLSSTFSWGAQSLSTEESKLDGFGTGLPGPGLHTLSSTAQRVVFGEEVRRLSAGVFVQNSIGIRDRAFLTVGARGDGNSAFGENLGIQFYPKASASWVISEENFWPEPLGQLKLRLAYGLAGRAPGAFDAVRTWRSQSFAGKNSFLPANIGNPDLGPEKTQELEWGFDGAWFDEALSVEFTVFHQITRDALFLVPQIPSNGFLGGQLENVGKISNQGLELMWTGQVVRTPTWLWTLGGSVATHRSEVLDTGSASTYTLQQGQPAPVVRGTLVRNAAAFEAPELVRDHFFGPSQPTLTLGLQSTLELPGGVRLSTRGEFQGGHYIVDGASRNMVDRGNGAPGCEAAYDAVPFTGFVGADLSGVRALDRVRCYRQTLNPGSWVYPADFFKLREVTLAAPVTRWVPGVRTAHLTLSLRNALRWTNRDFLAFDPEMISTRETTSALSSGITEHLPPPARITASVRVTF